MEASCGWCGEPIKDHVHARALSCLRNWSVADTYKEAA